MLIRTQDKNVLVNVDNLMNIAVAEPLQAGIFIIGVTDIDKSSVNMGRYSSEDKARKVLDLIEDAYKRDKALISYRNGYGVMNNSLEYAMDKIIFQMPEDSEVEI